MNGAPLPIVHGFPVRMVVPGLYGYVSATKWVTELKVTTFAADQGYWTPLGWSARGPIKIASRIDVPGAARRSTPGAPPSRGGVGPAHRHREGRGADRRRPVAAGPAGRDRRTRHLAAVGVRLGRRPPATTRSPSGPPTPTATCRSPSSRHPRRTGPPATTRSVRSEASAVIDRATSRALGSGACGSRVARETRARRGPGRAGSRGGRQAEGGRLRDRRRAGRRSVGAGPGRGVRRRRGRRSARARCSRPISWSACSRWPRRPPLPAPATRPPSPSIRPPPGPPTSRLRQERGLTTFGMEYVPRISRAQSMDALSSPVAGGGLPRGDRRRRPAARSSSR